MDTKEKKAVAPSPIEEANAILAKERAEGMTGIRFFVRDNRDLTDEDVVRGFCAMYKASAKDITHAHF